MKPKIYVQKTYGEWVVHFNVGNQYFSLFPGWPTKKEAEWQKGQLKIAFDNMR